MNKEKPIHPYPNIVQDMDFLATRLNTPRGDQKWNLLCKKQNTTQKKQKER